MYTYFIVSHIHGLEREDVRGQARILCSAAADRASRELKNGRLRNAIRTPVRPLHCAYFTAIVRDKLRLRDKRRDGGHVNDRAWTE